jgi:glycosyltransferase involved in cell wall biosynthesis
MTDPEFSVVVPMFNEAEGVRALLGRLVPIMDALGTWEIVCVNDGSRDTTLLELQALHAAEPRIAIVNLSRNFGKEIATTAGIDHARGAAVIVIDADLQDPPEVIPDLVAGWRAGYDMVYAQRRARAGETWMKRVTAAWFYRLMEHLGRVQMPRNTGDFRLMSRRVVDALQQMREQHRFMKGLFAWVGFPTLAVPYDRAARHAGTSKWGYWKLWNLALEGITSFTVMPLKVATYLGLVVALISVGYAGVIVAKTLFLGNPVAGYPSLVTIVLFLGGVQLMTLGVMGEYLGRIFNETKNRPLYFVERHTPSAAPAPAAAAPTGQLAEPVGGMAR